MQCESCGFSCIKRGDWNRHVKTQKHLKSHTGLRKLLEETQEQLRKQQKQIDEMKPFNITIFLDQCKDAMNWDEFISTLELMHPNIVKMMVDRIQELGVHRRPIHCLDWNKQKICIKHCNAWEMDSNKATSIIMDTTSILRQQYLKQWEETHPTWYENERDTDVYTSLLSNEEDTMVIVKSVLL